MAPAYVAGGSGGLVTSILMAHRYPEDIMGLILSSPGTDDFSMWTDLISGWYNDLADAADQGGMQAAREYSTKPERHWASGWLHNLGEANHRNYERILSTVPRFLRESRYKRCECDRTCCVRATRCTKRNPSREPSHTRFPNRAYDHFSY